MTRHPVPDSLLKGCAWGGVAFLLVLAIITLNLRDWAEALATLTAGLAIVRSLWLLMVTAPRG